ncbi:MAG: hypothetical protein IJP09_02355 [Clostridia bacterium]|nr:hypothetical protein [Clostridia bacterium]
MTTEKRKGFLLGVAAKGFLKGGSKAPLVSAKLLKPTKCKIILTVKNESEE